MIPWQQIDTAEVPGAEVELRLMRRGDEFSMMLGSNELMNSRLSGSEEALATLACRRIEAVKRPHLLIGGLGMGFTLRAALAVLGPAARIMVAGLVPAVTVTGSVHVDGPPNSREVAEFVNRFHTRPMCNISLRSGTQQSTPMGVPLVGNGPEFTIPNVFAGQYEARINCFGGYASSALAGGADLLAEPILTVSPGVAPPPIVKRKGCANADCGSGLSGAKARTYSQHLFGQAIRATIAVSQPAASVSIT